MDTMEKTVNKPKTKKTKRKYRRITPAERQETMQKEREWAKADYDRYHAEVERYEGYAKSASGRDAGTLSCLADFRRRETMAFKRCQRLGVKI